MAENKSAITAREHNNENDPSKAELQRRLEDARESISQTVTEIKDTVSDQYESVKDTVTDVLDWKEQFRDNPLVWGLGAIALGIVVGYGIGVAHGGAQSTGRKRSGASSTAADGLLDKLSTVGQTVVLPAITGKIKDLFGIDLSDQLLSLNSSPQPAPRKQSAKKRAAKKAAVKKGAARKSSAS